MMTWEETIIHARAQPEFKKLIEDSYLESDLRANVDKFRNSLEFKETRNILSKLITEKNSGIKCKLLDIGSGNGISSVAFALNNFNVVSLEPDISETVGRGAIQSLKDMYQLDELQIISAFGESLPFENATFDVVYARQALHHARDLDVFVGEAARVLKKGGILITVRDHVVNNSTQRDEFLAAHPFQQFYHGENAYSLEQYKTAFNKHKLVLKSELGPLDSVINFSPRSEEEIANEFKTIIKNKLNIVVPDSNFFNDLIIKLFKWKTNNMQNIAGRLYTFILKKQSE